MQHLLTSLRLTAVTIVLFGCVFPLLVTVVAHVSFPSQARGSLITRGRIVGSAIIGQRFSRPQYIHGRPSAAGSDGYDPTATGGTNLGPTSKKLFDATRSTIAAVEKENPGQGEPPIDLVTSSASGIDPDISPESARYQAQRVARERHISLQTVLALIDAHTQPRTLGILGEARVNVLELNLALDDERR